MNLKFSLFLALVALPSFCLCNLQESKIAFNNFKTIYNKQYSSLDEEEYRFQVFVKNVDYIENFNLRKDVTYKLGLNQFADLTNEEFKAQYLFKAPIEQLSVASIENISNVQVLPATWDWRTKGAVTPVTNEGQCGASSIFGVVAAMEGCHKISTGTLVELSEDQIIKCDSNQGCNGGDPAEIYQYISKHPINKYSCGSTVSCNYDPTCCGSNLTSVIKVIAGSESSLQAGVYTGPASAAIDASHSSFQFYASGVYYESTCSSTALDHEITVVGWGEISGTAMWIVKNSWGSDWGEDGYIYMSRNRNNNCGIASYAQVPQGCYNC